MSVFVGRQRTAGGVLGLCAIDVVTIPCVPYRAWPADSPDSRLLRADAIGDLA